MEKWCWVIKGYNTPKTAEITQRTPLPEQWIYCYRCQKEVKVERNKENSKGAG